MKMGWKLTLQLLDTWAVVVAATCGFAFATGWALINTRNAATVTWHAPFVGWAAILGGLWVAIDAVRWWRSDRGWDWWWIGLGLVTASIMARIPMALGRWAEGALPAAQAVDISAFAAMLTFTLLGLWDRFVIPTALSQKRRRDAELG